MSSWAKKFLADHFDTYEGKEDRNFRGLCGHGAICPDRRARMGRACL